MREHIASHEPKCAMADGNGKGEPMPKNDGNYLRFLGGDNLELASSASPFVAPGLPAETLAELRRVGLSLLPDDVTRLANERMRALESTDRVELGQGALPCLVDAFVESPYVEQDALAEQLSHIQAAFYQLRDGVDVSVSDAEIAHALCVAFDRAQGDLDALDGVEPADLVQAHPEDEFVDAAHDAAAIDDLDASVSSGFYAAGNADPDAGWDILQNAPWSSCEILTSDWR